MTNVLDRRHGPREDLPEGRSITPGQYRIIALKAMGYTTDQVAHELGMAPQTVKNHLYNAYKALGETTLVGAMQAMGWIVIPDQYAAHAPIRDGTSLGHD